MEALELCRHTIIATVSRAILMEKSPAVLIIPEPAGPDTHECMEEGYVWLVLLLVVERVVDSMETVSDRRTNDDEIGGFRGGGGQRPHKRSITASLCFV